MIEIEQLSKYYDGRPVLNGVSFAVGPGEVVAVLGPSGAGKTTLFRCLTRLIEPDRGEVRLFGRSLRGLRPGELRQARRNIGFVFQQHNLIRRCTAIDNVLAGRLGNVRLWRAVTKRFDSADHQRAYAALDRVDLLGFAHRRADQLSGGEQQRVAIARVLAQESLLILADEPVASLDPAAAVSVLSLLRDIAHADGITVLCSLHQVDLVPGFADRVLGLCAGRLVADTPIEQFEMARDYQITAQSERRSG